MERLLEVLSKLLLFPGGFGKVLLGVLQRCLSNVPQFFAHHGIVFELLFQFLECFLSWLVCKFHEAFEQAVLLIKAFLDAKLLLLVTQASASFFTFAIFQVLVMFSQLLEGVGKLRLFLSSDVE